MSSGSMRCLNHRHCKFVCLGFDTWNLSKTMWSGFEFRAASVARIVVWIINSIMIAMLHVHGSLFLH